MNTAERDAHYQSELDDRRTAQTSSSALRPAGPLPDDLLAQTFLDDLESAGPPAAAEPRGTGHRPAIPAGPEDPDSPAWVEHTYRKLP